MNTLKAGDRPKAIDLAAAGVVTRAIERPSARDLRPPLLTLALLLLAADTLLTLWLGGRLKRGMMRPATAALVPVAAGLLALGLLTGAPPALARTRPSRSAATSCRAPPSPASPMWSPATGAWTTPAARGSRA